MNLDLKRNGHLKRMKFKSLSPSGVYYNRISDELMIMESWFDYKEHYYEIIYEHYEHTIVDPTLLLLNWEFIGDFDKLIDIKGEINNEV